MPIAFDEEGVEPALKDMPDEPIVAIETLRVLAVDGPHARREVGLRGLEQEVVVVLASGSSYGSTTAGEP